MSARHHAPEGPAEGSAHGSEQTPESLSDLNEAVTGVETALATDELAPIYAANEVLTLDRLEEALVDSVATIKNLQQQVASTHEGTLERTHTERRLAVAEFNLTLEAASYGQLVLNDLTKETAGIAQASEGVSLLLGLVKEVPGNELLVRAVLRIYGEYKLSGGRTHELRGELRDVLDTTHAVAAQKAKVLGWPVGNFSPAEEYPRLLDDADEVALAGQWACQNLVDVLEQSFFEGHGVLPGVGEAGAFIRKHGLDPALAKNRKEVQDVLARLRAFNSCYDAAQPVHSGPQRPLAREATAELYRQWQHEAQTKSLSGRRVA